MFSCKVSLHVADSALETINSHILSYMLTDNYSLAYHFFESNGIM